MADDAKSTKQDGHEKYGGHGSESGKDKAPVSSKTPENADGKINPSAPGDTGTTEKTKD